VKAATGALLAAITFLAGVLVGAGAPVGGEGLTPGPVQLGSSGGGRGDYSAGGPAAPATSGSVPAKVAVQKVRRVVARREIDAYVHVPTSPQRDTAVLSTAAAETEAAARTSPPPHRSRRPDDSKQRGRGSGDDDGRPGGGNRPSAHASGPPASKELAGKSQGRGPAGGPPGHPGGPKKGRPAPPGWSR